MNIVELTRHDFQQYVRQIAEVHLGAYSSSHLTANFSLHKLEDYYRHLLNASELCVVALERVPVEDAVAKECVVGFIVAGSAVSEGISNFLRENRLYVLSVILRNPVFLFQKCHSLVISMLHRNKPSNVQFRLLSIAVRHDFQSCSIGKDMLTFFEGAISRRGVDCYGLSVRSTNQRANAFYEKNGFVFEKTFLGSKYYMKKLMQH